MNIFGFNTLEALVGLLAMVFIGTFVGFLIGLLRYILFSFMEEKMITNMGERKIL